MQIHTTKSNRLLTTLAMNHIVPVTHFKLHQVSGKCSAKIKITFAYIH